MTVDLLRSRGMTRAMFLGHSMGGMAGQLPEASTLGDKAAARMRNARFVPLPGLGHVPQVEDPARFQVALIQALGGALD